MVRRKDGPDLIPAQRAPSLMRVKLDQDVRDRSKCLPAALKPPVNSMPQKGTSFAQ
jgi:hypothetical protein